MLTFVEILALYSFYSQSRDIQTSNYYPVYDDWLPCCAIAECPWQKYLHVV